jgi:hypothetical protein
MEFHSSPLQVEEVVAEMTRAYSHLGLSCGPSSTNGPAIDSRPHPLRPNPTTVYNPTEWSLSIDIRKNYPGMTSQIGVYSKCYIPSNTYLGDLDGERMYAWEIPEEEYDKILWVMEDCVLRFNQTPRSILTYIREGFYMGLQTNCCITIDTTPQGEVLVGLKTTRPIYENQELLYWHPGLV